MEVVRSISTVREKQEDRGNMCMFLGYAKNNTGCTYHMLNILTTRIVLSRDVTWLKNTTDSTYQEKKIPKQTPISYKMKTIPIIELT